ncbi:uncharacterized protein LOC108734265 [Agrilus planipennis]|uniref:RNA-directed DNA polymerase n=1 Tax=Agrilus planipennis TaxID=224129 RepID=A0A1W4WMH0_AGRPL|nr:uncharacterized protein LOC108734265 [Agrilus planipennis]
MPTTLDFHMTENVQQLDQELQNLLNDDPVNVFHGPSHPSRRTTARQLKEKFVWPWIKRYVLQWSRESIACQRFKIKRHNRIDSRHIDIPDNCFDHVYLDIIELIEVNVPLPNIQADTIASAFFNYWVAQFGTPLTITTDQGTQFESRLFKSLTHMSRFKEDFNASPAQLMFGTELRIPGEFLLDVDTLILRIKSPVQTLVPRVESVATTSKVNRKCSPDLWPPDKVEREFEPVTKLTSTIR